ncbi:MAG TPA: ribonuclease domain-containing protein [Thermoanaerobaculia bacterium]|jgi:ribonuclease T1
MVRRALALLPLLAFLFATTLLAKQTPNPRIEKAVHDAAERAELLATLQRIERGGPFPYAKDGATFSNREHRLPSRPRGYYREYTVITRGAPNRGARRVIRGKDGETWYTRDHYRTFVRLDPLR